MRYFEFVDITFEVAEGAVTVRIVSPVAVGIWVFGSIIVHDDYLRDFNMEWAFRATLRTFHAFEEVGVHGCGGVVLMRGSKSPRNSPKLQFGQ